MLTADRDTSIYRFERIQNELYRLLYGREEIPARWKFCIAYVNGNLGMSVGSLFVRKYFDGQSKQDVRIIIFYLVGWAGNPREGK